MSLAQTSRNDDRMMVTAPILMWMLWLILLVVQAAILQLQRQPLQLAERAQPASFESPPATPAAVEAARSHESGVQSQHASSAQPLQFRASKLAALQASHASPGPNRRTQA